MIFKAYKVVSSLPSPLEANAIYAVRVGEGFDLYISDLTGSIAHKINEPTAIDIFTTNVEIISTQKNLTIDSAKYQFLSSATNQIVNLPDASTVTNKEFLLVNKGNFTLEVRDNNEITGLFLNNEGRAFCVSTGINWEVFVDYSITGGLNETSTIDGGIF